MKDIKSFPVQKLPQSRKTQAWKEACVDYICGAGNVGAYGFNNEEVSEMLTYYDLYLSLIHI